MVCVLNMSVLNIGSLKIPYKGGKVNKQDWEIPVTAYKNGDIRECANKNQL